MTVHVGPYEFDRVSYDKDGDVLYLRRAPAQVVTETFGSPEGHAVCLDERREIIGITLINAKWLSERDGGLRVTVPRTIETDLGDLAKVLTEA